MKNNNPLVRTLRLIRVGLLILSGTATVVFLFHFLNDLQRARQKQRWSKTLLLILGIQADANLGHVRPGSLIVANHISWLDIFVINAVLPCAFVSKAEVRHWPLIGWLAAVNETVFLRRGSHGHASLINREIAQKLNQGKHVVVFPEGTTTDGLRLLSFHAALIQPALAAGRPVVPLAISYWEPGGKRSLAPRYDGQISFGECLKSIAARPHLKARLQSLPALGLHSEDRRTVAQAAHAAIAEVILSPGEAPLGLTNRTPEISQELVAA
ncbi:MAG: 2-acyl-glycerophospho-ethanolamine acyltransferase [Betaproteobacteria bacterium ADurb.Bin341]|nr:MAG: 2-acyl-glycerophospho-ethanolamine acyltransferase [Betaproteobacteria bacterium ADurb.Bin341]